MRRLLIIALGIGLGSFIDPGAAFFGGFAGLALGGSRPIRQLLLGAAGLFVGIAFGPAWAIIGGLVGIGLGGSTENKKRQLPPSTSNGKPEYFSEYCSSCGGVTEQKRYRYANGRVCSVYCTGYYGLTPIGSSHYQE